MSEDANLVPVQAFPFNAETPLDKLSESITPIHLVYVRNHFDVPKVDVGSWRLQVDGMVENPIRLSLADLQGLPRSELVVTMECAGNGRTLMKPIPPGTPWRFGAVSTFRVTGTPLRGVLQRAKMKREAVEVLFVGADRGRVKGPEDEPFARSLGLESALNPSVLIAWALNGRPLNADHGFPARLIVPSWYGMASVKWLVKISLLSRPFQGHFQTENYMYEGMQGTKAPQPVTLMRVRSLISWPMDESDHPMGKIGVRGLAWSGEGRIKRVEISTDQGVTWEPAELGKSLSPYSATPWNFQWRPTNKGNHTIMTRATDNAGNVQPSNQVWNARGFGNNAVERVRVTIR